MLQFVELALHAAMSNERKMGKQKFLLYFVFLCVIGASVDAMLGEEDGTHSTGHCVHEIDYINQVGTCRLASYPGSRWAWVRG